MIFQKLCCLLAFGALLTTGEFVFLNTGVFKFIAGVGLPIDVGLPGSSVTWFTNVQVFYKLPDNITQYEPYKIMEKRSVRNTFNRHAVYRALERYLERLGFHGNQCVHRLICEVAKRKLNRRTHGFFGRIVRILFSPERDPQRGLEEHKKAQRRGLHNDTDCGVAYEDCFTEDGPAFLGGYFK